MTRPTNPVAIVTGGSHGAGRAIALQLGRRGYGVVVVYLHDRAQAEAAVDDILATQGTAVTVRADVADELDVERVFGETAALFGGVDVVVLTGARDTWVVYQQAARQLRRGGAIISVATSGTIAPTVADELAARGVTVNGLAPGVEPPGADRDTAELVSILDRWRHDPGWS